MATIAEKIQAWKAAKAELKNLRDQYVAKKQEAAAIAEQIRIETGAALSVAEDDI
jgi:predicted  nucleic acid-binding Zn-ribbon protein